MPAEGVELSVRREPLDGCDCLGYFSDELVSFCTVEVVREDGVHPLLCEAHYGVTTETATSTYHNSDFDVRGT